MNVLNIRRREIKKASKNYPGRKMAFLGGILYFFKNGVPTREVPNAKKVPKEGKDAVGVRIREKGVSSKEIRYSNLSKPKGPIWDKKCFSCDSNNLSMEMVRTSDRGNEWVRVCRSCGRLMQM